jgi:hypothetical protein
MILQRYGAMIFLWSALGLPFKWQKFRGGQQIEWVGYWLAFDTFQIGISAKCAAWLRNWIEKAVK